MNPFFRWLLGLKDTGSTESGGSWRVEFRALPQESAALVVLGIALLTAVVVVWLYRREGQSIPRPARIFLSVLRLGIIGLVTLMLLEAVLIKTEHEQVPSRLLVLLDTSESMGLKDSYADEDVARRIVAALGIKGKDAKSDLNQMREKTRLALAERACAQILPELGDGRKVSIYAFDGKPRGVAADALAKLTPSGASTAAGSAIEAALAEHRGQPLSGILLVTDGQSNAGADLRKAAQAAGQQHAPIMTLEMGTEQGPRNARLVDIESNPVAFVKDPIEIAVMVDSRGMKSQPAIVSLEKRQEGSAWVEIDRADIILNEDSTLHKVPFKFTPDTVGLADFRARVLDAGPELTEADNVALKPIRIVRQTIRVLVVAGYPSPEFQFLRNALMRDNRLEVATWLQGAGDKYEQVGSRPLRRLPTEQREINQYDVIVLFDPDMKSLGANWSDLLVKFVGDAGGGLVYVAGEMNSKPLFASSTGTGDMAGVDAAWLRTLPVVLEPGLYQSAAEVQLSLREPYNLELTPEGLADPIFHYAADPARNREVLASLPGMYWHFAVSRAKPGATILARHGDPRMTNNFGRHVLLAMQRYGPGQTLFIGFDSTFRWRYLNEDYFDGFWARVVDRLGRNKALGGQYPFTLSLDKSTYRAGDRATLRIQPVGQNEQVLSPEMRAELEAPGQGTQPLEVEPSKQQHGALEASFVVQEAGPHLIRVTPTAATSDSEAAPRPATVAFRVEPPQQELDQPTLNRGMLEDVAHLSGGQAFALADVQRIPAAFKVRLVDRFPEYRKELWDVPLLFGLFVVLLTVEWVLRKHYRLA